jgi:beta-fructofuranosidase
MAGLRLAAVVFHICLLVLPSSSLRRLNDEAKSTPLHGGSRTAYHFQPAKNWQNGTS